MTPQEWIQLINALGSAGENLHTAFTANDKLNNNLKALEYTNIIKQQNEAKKNDIAARNAVNTANFTESQKDLKQSFDFLESYNVTRDLYKDKILEKYKSGDMPDILKQQGIEITDDLEIRMKDVQTLAEKQKQYTHATQYMNEIDDSLNIMESNIMGLNEELRKVEDKGLVRGAIDIQDINTHIEKPENRDTFKDPVYGVDDEGNTIITSYEDNYLARAFRTPEKWSQIRGKTGFVQKVTPLAKSLYEDKTYLGINQNFKTLDALKSSVGRKFLTKFGLGENPAQIKKGGIKQFKSPEALAAAQPGWEDGIIKLIEWGNPSWKYKENENYKLWKETGQPRYRTLFIGDAHKVFVGAPEKYVDGKLVSGSTENLIKGKWNQSYDLDFRTGAWLTDYGHLIQDDYFYAVMDIWKGMHDLNPSSAKHPGLLTTDEKLGATQPPVGTPEEEIEVGMFGGLPPMNPK